MSAYKQEFLSEARENLEKLNENLLAIEKDYSNAENINAVFRAFHTLKGNSAAMGYMTFSELAHTLEDVLALIKEKKIKVTKNIMDELFEGCDIIEEGLEQIENDNSESIDAEGFISRLKKLHEKESEKVSIEQKATFTEEEDAIISQKEKEMSIFRVVIVFDRKNPINGAKSMLILKSLSEISEIIKTIPSKEIIREGKFETEIDIVVATKEPKENVEKAAGKVSGIKHLFVLGLHEEYVKPDETARHEKEIEKAKIAQQHHADVVKQIQSIRVDMKKLDKLMNLMGELLISNIRLNEIHRKRDYESIKTIIAGLDRLIMDLHDEVMEVRMVPIGNIFNRFPRMVRDLAGKEGKKIELAIEGSEIELDRTVLDQMGEPLVHLLRNCVDHGIEEPALRVAAGKNEEGTIKLIARREKSSAVIEVEDDGAGIDPQRVKEACIRKGMISKEDADKLSDKDLQMLIFRPGASTNEIVTDVSGRGVGMDVVMTKVKELGGNVKMESKLGKGTTVTMELPLTLAIISALLVKVKTETYAIPLNTIDQTVDITVSQIKTISGKELFVLRNTEIPLFWLQEIVGYSDPKNKEKLTVVIANKGDQKIGLVVDSIVAQQQILIKGFQDMIKGTKGFAGATILGDGTVSLIIDIGTIV
ncbi:chemotaxis protein CheA [Candidatus Woesearchaeota archaeon]|nr:chemotaxis protein CheA [Candidatus Woesearchaeota archaeon]